MSQEDFTAYNQSAEDIAKKFDTDPENGLTDEQVQSHLEKYGRNELEEEERDGLVKKFFDQFKDLMIIVLLIAAVVSVVVSGHLSDGIIILLVVVINAILGVYQESKAEDAIDALKEMASPDARVRRNGRNQTIKSTDIVPGDLIVLEAGDVVPADLRLFSANSLQIEEAALTGESVASEKNTETINEGEVGIGDRLNMGFSSTNVTYGNGRGVVTATGQNTEVGNIADMLSSADKIKTPLQQDQDELSKFLTYAIIIIAVVTFLIGVFIQGFDIATMLLTSVSLAVAALPEGLPAITTVILSIGTQNMADRNALIRTLPAVETLGSTQVICSDKTGTLTQNKMTIEKAYFNGSIQDAEEKIDLNNPLFKAITFANNSEKDEDGTYKGDPTESAMLKFAEDQGYDYLAELEKTPRLDEVPFESDRKMMSTIHQLEDGRYFIATKGAPDQVIKYSTTALENGEVVEFSDERKQGVDDANTQLAEQAIRVLAGAYKIVDEMPSEITVETMERDLTFAGLVGMIDPERPEAKASIATAKDAGVRTVMITGDHAITAQAIAERLEILDSSNPKEENKTHVLTGAELNDISDDELKKNVHKYSVYARVSPEHKVRIIKAWQKNDAVVAMTGDGVNDAPSLKQANIGVGMGITGTEVSKSASDMVLADDNFATIVAAVQEGRKVFANIQKAVQFLLSANLGEVITLFFGTLFGWEILEPIHILWINLVTDTFPAIALGMEPAEADLMDYKPRDSDSSFLSDGILPSIAYQGILEGVLTLFAYWFTEYQLNMGHDVAKTVAFSTLGLIQLVHAYNVKHTFASIFSENPFNNKYLNIATLFSGFLLLVVILFPPISQFFSVAPMSGTGWLFVVAISASMLIIVEIIKAILRATGVDDKYKKKV